MAEVGDSFRVGEVWVSPRGTYYRVVARDGWHATLRCGLTGSGRKHKRPWGDVIGWVRPPEHNTQPRPPDMTSALERAREWLAFKCDGDAMRCHDGGGCECIAAGRQPEGSIRSALADLVAEIDAAPVADAVSTDGYPVALDGYSISDDDALRSMIGHRVRLLAEAPGHGE